MKMKEVESPLTGEEIVISGISGVFPKSESVNDFMNNLFDKVDMVTEEPRWSTKDPELPRHVGKVSGTEKFDAQFFKVGFSQAQVLEPISKKLLEHAYGAIFDSGNTHVSLRGTTIGVFTGTSYADFSSLCLFAINIQNDCFVGGSSKAMVANRISYWVDGKGTSYNLDLSCASSSAALEQAVNAMKAGHCDAAIVGAGNLCSHPGLTINLKRYGVLCSDGKTKCFDKDSDGYVRAEAANVIFLQKAKNAKRIYAEVYHTKGTYKLKPGSPLLPTRQTEELEEFMKNVYADVDIDPTVVEYIEAHGAALPQADNNELQTVAKLFASNKTVKIGCVKSNMGNSESVSGLCGLTKLCLAYHKGQIPANLHYNNPPSDIKAVHEGKLKVVTENTDFGRKFTALNNFSLTGANFHTILKGHYKQKNVNKYECKIPRIVVASGRLESAVDRIFDDLIQRPIDAEEMSLIHDIFSSDITEHTNRGYVVLDTNRKEETVSYSRSIDYYPGIKRPLWFVYSGMGSQWAGMGADLMRIPTFAAAIERCHKVLEPKGIDLIKVVTEIDNKIFDNILNAFVGIGAVQIGLTDILKDMGIIPDYIIGHSLGEMACAYHDDTITAEELILLTYSRGKAILDSNLQPGTMAAVGIGYKELSKWCPPDIDIGCHNSSESSTISGPVESMKKFVAELTAKGIFAREVASANIAYHSRYVAEAGPELLRRLKIILQKPKKRSQKWISTSVPQDKWDSPLAKYASAEYHTNNLVSPVLFEEVSSMIPANAVVVEIAPHALLQAILKRSHKDCIHIPLTKRGNMEGVKLLLDAIGKLYLAGFNPKVSSLYPKVEYPVSTETPLLSHLVEWEHSENWPPLLKSMKKHTSPSRDIVFSAYDDDYNFVQGYIVNGIPTLSEAALLVIVWETLAMYSGVNLNDLCVIFKDIQFHNTVVIDFEMPVRLSVGIMRGNNNFEVSQDGRIVVSGTISGAKKLSFYHGVDGSKFNKEDEIILNSEDVYKILHAQGFDYSDNFKTIHQTNLERNKALIKWTNNWITFLDGLIKLNCLSKNFKRTSKIKLIRKMRICAVEQERVNQISVCENDLYHVQVHKEVDVTRCGGVEIEKIIFVEEPKVEKECDVFMSRSFYPYINMEIINIKSAIEISLQIATENSTHKDVAVVITSLNAMLLINEVVCNDFYNNFEVKNVEENFDKIFKCQDHNKTNIIVVENILQDKMKIKILQSLLSETTFVLSIEDQVPEDEKSIKEHFSVISSMSDGNKCTVLMKKLINIATEDVIYIPVTMEEKFRWVPKVYTEINTAKRVVLISERHQYCGLVGFVKKLKDGGYSNISVFANDDSQKTEFNIKSNLFKEQLNKNMIYNVLKKGQFGGYYYTSCTKSTAVTNVILKTGVSGDVDNLSWVEVSKLSAENNIAQVCYSGIGINDYKNAVTNENEYFGMDFSGIDKNGKKVMGFAVKEGAVAISLQVDSDLTWSVPGHWTIEDAATVPMPFITAYYCLKIRTQLHENYSIFVTDAVSPLGQAIISICLAYKCTIFATVQNETEQKALLQIFPELSDEHICSSGKDDFYQMIMSATNKNGCHIVINTSSGYLKTIAEYCVRRFGTFLDLNKHDMKQNNEWKMGFLNMERSYKVVDVSNIFRPQFSKDKKLLHKYFNEGIEKGIVKPLNRTVFPLTELSKAFSLLTSSQNFGRILVRIRDSNVSPQNLNILPRIDNISADDVTIIVCDEGGIGVELSERFVERGAKKLILHINSVSGYVQTKLLSWGKQEVSVKVSTENLQTERGCAALMKNATKFGKVTGIFVVLDSKNSDNGEAEEFVDAFNKKCLMVLNLDAASRSCGDLNHFVILSRMMQSASDEYSLSLLERFCDLRNEMGLPTLVLRFESLVEQDRKQSHQNVKLSSQSLSAFFNSIERSLKQKCHSILAMVTKHKDRMNLDEKHCRNNDGNHLSNKTGLSVFINEIVDEEVHVEHQPIVELPTLLNRNIESPSFISRYAEDNEPNYTDDCIIMIPGFESRSDIFKLAAERLKIPAYCVHIEPDMIGNSFREIAINVLKAMKTKIRIGSRFNVLGYSLGVNIALELASLLENEGLVGKLFCLDSSPSALKIQLNSHLGQLTQPELQNNILIHISQIISRMELKDLGAEIKELETFGEKLNICVKRLQKTVTYSREYMKSVFDTVYQEIVLAKEYKPDLKLESEIVLIKGLNESVDMLNDYDLSKLSFKPVKVHDIPSDHVSAPNDCRVSVIVNKYLDKKLLEEFKKKSLCYVYVSED